MSGDATYRHLLRTNSDFRRLFSAQLISAGGDWFASIALVGLTLDLTGSGLAAALVLAANFLPFFLFSPAAGVLADRLDRKKLMIGSDLARAILALGMLLVGSAETVWLGIVSIAGIASMGAFFMPASQAALPNLVTKDQLSRANVLMGSAWSTMLAVGAAVGGLVATYLGRDAAFVINALTFLVSALLVARIRGRFSAATPGRVEVHPIRDVHEGVAYARSHPQVMALLATKAGFGFGAGVIALLPIFARDVFEGGDLTIGILFSARGLGAFLGPFAARAFVGESSRRLFLAIGAAMATYGFAYLLFPAAPVIWLAALVATLAHLGGGSQWMLSTYGLQVSTPDYVRGRILAFDFGMVTLSMSLSFLLAGWLAGEFGPQPVMVGLALFEIFYAVVWTLGTRRFWSVRAPALRFEFAPGEGVPPGE